MRLTSTALLVLAVCCAPPQDADGDGVTEDADCDDGDATTRPGAEELCDGIDNDCDGAVDEDFDRRSTFWVDADGDGYGDPAAAVRACAAPTGTVEDATDCDDGDGRVFPGAEEHCDGRDEDCDGEIDEDAVDRGTWYTDADADGYGDPATGQAACEPPSGAVAVGSDCDDADHAVSPTGAERCNGIDDDCDGLIDDDDDDLLDGQRWFPDDDGDGFGDLDGVVEACDPPEGHVTNAFDCDDDDGAVHPSAIEVCNDLDDDCDGLVDVDDIDVDPSTLVAIWLDADADGYGAGTVADEVCQVPDGFAPTDDDCDDTDATVHPDATEVPGDGIDQDCDGADGG